MYWIRKTDTKMRLIRPDDVIGQWSEREVKTPEGLFTELYFVTKTGKETVSGLIKITDKFLGMLRSSDLAKKAGIDRIGEVINKHAVEKNSPLYYVGQAYFDLEKSLTWHGKLDRWRGRKDRLYNEWLRAHYACAIEEKNNFSIDTLDIGLTRECSVLTWPADFKSEPYIDKFAKNIQRTYKDSQTWLGSIYEHGL